MTAGSSLPYAERMCEEPPPKKMESKSPHERTLTGWGRNQEEKLDICLTLLQLYAMCWPARLMMCQDLHPCPRSQPQPEVLSAVVIAPSQAESSSFSWNITTPPGLEFRPEVVNFRSRFRNLLMFPVSASSFASLRALSLCSNRPWDSNPFYALGSTPREARVVITEESGTSWLVETTFLKNFAHGLLIFFQPWRME